MWKGRDFDPKEFLRLLELWRAQYLITRTDLERVSLMLSLDWATLRWNRVGLEIWRRLSSGTPKESVRAVKESDWDKR